MVRLGLIGVGIGLFAGPIQTGIMNAAPRDRAGTTSAISGLGRNLGFALGPALATAMCSGLSGMRMSLGLMLLVAAVATMAAVVSRRLPSGSAVQGTA